MPGVRFATFVLLLSGAACDSAPGPGDAGEPDSGPGTQDAGPDASGPMCREDIRRPWPGTPCSMATAECARGCADRRCAEDCFLRDPSPDCIRCWDENQIACWNRNGCQAQWNCVAQCIQDNCPTATPECIGAMCSREDQAYADCFDPHYTICLERTVDCLP